MSSEKIQTIDVDIVCRVPYSVPSYDFLTIKLLHYDFELVYSVSEKPLGTGKDHFPLFKQIQGQFCRLALQKSVSLATCCPQDRLIPITVACVGTH